MAGARPLTNKEIALMLRSGYSSESVLQDVTVRRVVDRLDAPTKKALLEAGASPQLISALENGSFALSTAEANQAKQQDADLAARRREQIEQDRKFNTLYQAQAQARAQAAATAKAPPGTPILEALKDKLVRCHDGTITHADSAALDNKKLIALYYSAHWCAPCRKFTPDLVEYYNRIAPAHPELEIIFVSADRSRFGWETYLRETRMPWLAVDYDQLGAMASLKQLGGESIPSLLILDSSSAIVASSYDGEKYLGPQHALETLDQIFARNSAAAAARTH